MKKLLKIVIGLVVVFVLAIGIVFWLTSGMAETADAFFKAVKKQDLTGRPLRRCRGRPIRLSW